MCLTLWLNNNFSGDLFCNSEDTASLELLSSAEFVYLLPSPK